MNTMTIIKKGKYVNSDVMVVGVDIGKEFHVAVVRRRDNSFTPAFKFSSDAAGFNHFWDWSQGWYEEDKFLQILVGVESTGHYWETLAHWLKSKGVEVVQVNPLHTHKAKDLFDNNPGKTDKKDARIITDLVSQGKFLRCILPQGRYADLRYLVLLRKRLVREQTAELNIRHRVMDVLFPEFTKVFTNFKTKSSNYLLSHYYTPDLLLACPYEKLVKTLHQTSHGRLNRAKLVQLYELARVSVGIKAGLNGLKLMLERSLVRGRRLSAEIQRLEARMEGIVITLPETVYLRSVKGIGLITVAVILGETGGLGHYTKAEEIIKLAGLNLYEISSGKHRGKRRISRRGRSVLRYGLYLAAVGVVRRHGPLRSFYERLIQGGKYKAVALIAVACKLMRVLFALVRDKCIYKADYLVSEVFSGVA